MIVALVIASGVLGIALIVGLLTLAVLAGERHGLPPATARALRRNRRALRLKLPKERTVKRMKLSLNRETIATLTEDRLRLARGGDGLVPVDQSITGIPKCVGCETEILSTCLIGRA